MSVNIYVDSTYLVSTTGQMIKPAPTLTHQGANRVVCLQKVFAVATGDGDGSIYRIFDNVPSSYIPLFGTIANDALSGFTSASLGLYGVNLGPVALAAAFLSAQSLAGATTSNSPKTAIDAFLSLTLANTGKKLWELVSGVTLTNPVPAYDIALTATTRGTAVGNISVQLFFAQG